MHLKVPATEVLLFIILKYTALCSDTSVLFWVEYHCSLYYIHLYYSALNAQTITQMDDNLLITGRWQECGTAVVGQSLSQLSLWESPDIMPCARVSYVLV